MPISLDRDSPINSTQSNNLNSSIMLTKGERISLNKDNPNLDTILVGLGWDINYSGGEDFDLDASVLMLGCGDKLERNDNFIYYKNLLSPCGSIHHYGDNRTGAGEGDDEVIEVKLKSIPTNVEKLVFIVSIYEARKRRQNFGMVNNAFIRIVDKMTNKELLRYNLTEDFSREQSVIVAEIYRYNGEWKFNAKGQGVNGELADVLRMYGVMV